jgi:Protein kinase domain
MAVQPDRSCTVAKEAGFMERTTFLKNYRIRLQHDGTPYAPDIAGPATSYEAVDERTGEPVDVTLITAESIDPTEREGFEEHVLAAQKLRHVNIAKVLDFGREGDDYVYVSERLAGETLASWVHSHGPMPADAALRVGEQIASVLSSAGFHKLPYPPIQPSDVMLVPGQTAEGSWPLVKVTKFGLPALIARPEHQLTEPAMPDQAVVGEQVTNDRQFGEPTKDIPSELYSLGVTLYFLLTGIALSTQALHRGPKFSGFPKPLLVLLGRLLHRDPDQRPKDLLVVTELIRESLGKIERRRALSDRYGIPLRTTVPRPREARPRRLVRSAAVVGVLLLLAAAIAPVVFPDSISKLVRGSQRPKQVGVLVGVPDSSPAASSPRAVAQLPSNTSMPPAVVSSQPVNPTVLPETQASPNAATSPNPFHVAPADVQQAQMASAQPNAAENAAAATPDTSAPADKAANSSAQANVEPQPARASHSTAQSKKESVASTAKRSHSSRNSAAYSPRGRTGSVRSRVMGITSDGRLILRLPSGRTAIVAPDDEESAPRHRNRGDIDRDQMFGPPPGFGSDNFPDD